MQFDRTLDHGERFLVVLLLFEERVAEVVQNLRLVRIQFECLAEIGFGLLAVFGGQAALLVYAGMVGALSIAFLASWRSTSTAASSLPARRNASARPISAAWNDGSSRGTVS